MRTLRIGVIGLNFGYQHVRTLANMEGVSLCAVANAASPGLESCAAQYHAKPYRDGAKMLRDEKLDGVVIATSPRRRAELLQAAADSGAAAFVEKPWATNARHASELADLCTRAKARIMLGFSFRYLPAIARLRELAAGELGRPLLATGMYISNWLPPAEAWLWDPANGGGYFNENSCHLFDGINSILGRPVSVQAQTRQCFGRPAADAGLVLVRYEDDAIASLAIGGIGANAMSDYPQMEVFCVNGQARLTGRGHIWEALGWASRTDGSMHTFSPAPEALGETRYSRALREFCACIRESKPFPSTIDDGVICVKMAEAVNESARTGRIVSL